MLKLNQGVERVDEQPQQVSLRSNLDPDVTGSVPRCGESLNHCIGGLGDPGIHIDAFDLIAADRERGLLF